MPNEVEIILRAVDKASGTFKKVGGESEALKESMKGLGIALGVVATAATAAVTVWKQTVEPLISYNKAILDAGRATRMGVEDLSRFVQVGDDMGVGMESITRALQMATKNGFAPSITAIADLADKANAMNAPTERAAMLAKMFGRNWAELDPILQLGGQRIRDLAKAQADGLVVTEKEIEQSERMRLALDELGDRWTAFRNEMAIGILDEIESAEQWQSAKELRVAAYNDLIERGIKPTVQAVSVHVVEMRKEAEGLDAVALAAGRGVREVGSLANAIAAAKSKSITVTAVGQRRGDKAVLDFFLGGMGAGHWGVTEQMGRNQSVTDVIDAANAAAAAASAQQNAWKAGMGGSSGGGKQEGFASGADFVVPPGYPNDSFPMRAQSGERVQVTPAGKPGGGGGGVTINVNSSPMDVQYITKALKAAVGM